MAPISQTHHKISALGPKSALCGTMQWLASESEGTGNPEYNSLPIKNQ